jgi:hypothetical protein
VLDAAGNHIHAVGLELILGAGDLADLDPAEDKAWRLVQLEYPRSDVVSQLALVLGCARLVSTRWFNIDQLICETEAQYKGWGRKKSEDVQNGGMPEAARGGETRRRSCPSDRLATDAYARSLADSAGVAFNSYDDLWQRSTTELEAWPPVAAATGRLHWSRLPVEAFLGCTRSSPGDVWRLSGSERRRGRCWRVRRRRRDRACL